MTIIDRQVEETYVPVSLGDLSHRVRALERAEPGVVGDLRTSVLAELALIQLEVERLSLDAWRVDGHERQTDAHAAALSEKLDRLSTHWPHAPILDGVLP